MELTTLIMIWTLVTTTVVGLGYARMRMGLHDVLRVHLTGGQPAIDPDEVRLSQRIRTLDRVGIPLTVLSALLALVIFVVWAMEQAGPS
jgi:hypothetical protein